MIHTPKRKDALILICLFTLMNSLIKCRVLQYSTKIRLELLKLVWNPCASDGVIKMTK